MAENKTKPTTRSVAKHIAALPNEAQRKDCRALVRLMRRVTSEKPRLWGPNIVGFGSYHYKYASGREGDSALAAFAARGREIVVYVFASGPDQEARLRRLGRHRMGKSCLYIRTLDDVDVDVLEQVVAGSVAEVKRRYDAAEPKR
ncbi:MAG TPA: DUF1801 domain-containing protein [Pseudomonadales bacterium]